MTNQLPNSGDSMRYPAIIVDHARLRDNVEKICRRCADTGIFVAGVIKGASGMVSVAEDFVAGGAKMIASSRLEQLKRCKEAGISVSLLMIRVPMLSELDELVETAEYSLNSELRVLRALNETAAAHGVVHKVILMADLGDLREGYFDHGELVDAARIVENELGSLELAGIGTNLGCYGSVMATEDKMQQLADLAVLVEEAVGHELEIVSGGATSSLMGVFSGYMPKKINMLRIGAGILAGPLEDMRTCYGYTEMDELNDDVFTLETQVIEKKRKASHPIGKLGVDAFGKKQTYTDRGERMRALVAIGRADYGDIADLVPTVEGMEIIGASGDHTILDIEDVKEAVEVGDIITFKLKYSAILRITGSENVWIYERSGQAE